MPYYRKHPKLQEPLTDDEFIEAMNKGKFIQRKHKGFTALLYYTAVRKGEALRSVKEQFRMTRTRLFFEVGKRLKHGKLTGPLPIPLKAPFVKEIIWAIDNTDPKARVWPYCPKTGYNIVSRVLPAYPHYFRLSRITNFFLMGWSIAQVRAWTGLTLSALDFYVGLVDIMKMGASLGSSRKTS